MISSRKSTITEKTCNTTSSSPFLDKDSFSQLQMSSKSRRQSGLFQAFGIDPGNASLHTPVKKQKNSFLGEIRTSISPNSTQSTSYPSSIYSTPLSSKYALREGRNKIKMTLHNDITLPQPFESTVNRIRCRIQFYSKNQNILYMNDHIDSISDYHKSMINHLKLFIDPHSLSSHHTIESKMEIDKDVDLSSSDLPSLPISTQSLNLSPIGVSNPESVYVIGRILLEIEQENDKTHNNEILSKNLLIEGDLEISSGQRVKLVLSSNHQHSIFPGQIVFCKGLDTTGHCLFVEELIPFQHLPFNTLSSRSFFSSFHPLSILLATGPFTTSDNLEYLPLDDLLSFVLSSSPPIDLLILTGPFIDENHPLIQNNLEINYNQLFQQIVQKKIVDNLISDNQTLTQVIIIPHLRDIHHHFVYPQPPFDFFTREKDQLYFCSNPSTFLVNDLTISLSCLDILAHLSQQEISNRVNPSERIERLVSHILDQHSLYPLFPPHPDAPIDYSLFRSYNLSELSVSPDILILPSILQPFALYLSEYNVIAINPGSLSRYETGGSYARITAYPPLSQSEKDDLSKRIRVDIINI